MDNQQERLDAARLAMFFDTDGCISMRVSQRMKHRAANVTPYALLVNTSRPLCIWAHQALERLQIPHYCQFIDMQKYIPNRCRMPQGRITILGLNRVPKLLDAIGPYLVAKKQQAELLAEFCCSRLAQVKKSKYTDRELEIANTIRSLNSNKSGAWRPISSESIRQTQELRTMLNEKMCSDLHGDMQSVAETTTPTTTCSE
jgi:hypothetical protein